MFLFLITTLALLNTGHTINILIGPSGTTQEVGASFKLKCAVANKLPTDSVFWTLTTGSLADEPKLLMLDRVSKHGQSYELEKNTYNLLVKNASHEDDGVFKCEAGTDSRSARVYIYDRPDSMTLDWEHSINKPGAVEAGQEYKLRCSSKHSYPLATHRYYKDGFEMSTHDISYIYNNDTITGYGDTLSTLPFTPTSQDVSSMKSIRCETNLYGKKNVSAVAFAINNGPLTRSVGVESVAMICLVVLVFK